MYNKLMLRSNGIKVAAAAVAAASAGVSLFLFSRTRRERSGGVSLRRWVLCVCAMREEALKVEGKLDNVRVVEWSLTQPKLWQSRRTTGTLHGLRVDVLTCGIGEVDAAIATAALLTQEHHRELGLPEVVLSIGCAGAHVNKQAQDNEQQAIHAGDVVVGSAVVPAACKVIKPDGKHDHIGQRIGMGREALAMLTSDARLVEAAERVSAGLVLPAWPNAGQRQPRVIVGRVCSSDIWAQEAGEIQRLCTELGTSCEEMEAFGVFRACSLFGITRCIAIKDISNNELIEGEATNGTLFKASDKQDETPAWNILDEIGSRAATVAIAVIREIFLTKNGSI